MIDQFTKDSFIKHLMKVVMPQMLKFNILIIPTLITIIFEEEIIVEEEVTVEILCHFVVDIIKQVIIVVVAMEEVCNILRFFLFIYLF